MARPLTARTSRTDAPGPLPAPIVGKIDREQVLALARALARDLARRDHEQSK